MSHAAITCQVLYSFYPVLVTCILVLICLSFTLSFYSCILMTVLIPLSCYAYSCPDILLQLLLLICPFSLFCYSCPNTPVLLFCPDTPVLLFCPANPVLLFCPATLFLYCLNCFSCPTYLVLISVSFSLPVHVLLPFASRVLISLHYCPNTFVLLPMSYFSFELVATYLPYLLT